MSLAERIKRKIVPQRGFCSLSPASGDLLSGNGAVSIELTCDPYSEQVPFRHEMLYAPRRRPAESPKIAEVFPQVRQLLLDGKYHEAAELGYKKWHENPIQGGGMGFGGGAGFSMRLEFPRTESVKDYLRTVDFESTEVKTYWTDERGDWVRRIFASRPDNLVVQWLTAPKGQSVNVRIALSEGAGGRGGRGGRGGGAARGGAAGCVPVGERQAAGPAIPRCPSTSNGWLSKAVWPPGRTTGATPARPAWSATAARRGWKGTLWSSRMRPPSCF